MTDQSQTGSKESMNGEEELQMTLLKISAMKMKATHMTFNSKNLLTTEKDQVEKD